MNLVTIEKCMSNVDIEQCSLKVKLELVHVESDYIYSTPAQVTDILKERCDNN